jgi:hypothetical protein
VCELEANSEPRPEEAVYVISETGLARKGCGGTLISAKQQCRRAPFCGLFSNREIASGFLRNSRQAECGAKQFLTHLGERAAPFALLVHGVAAAPRLTRRALGLLPRDRIAAMREALEREALARVVARLSPNEDPYGIWIWSISAASVKNSR